MLNMDPIPDATILPDPGAAPDHAILSDNRSLEDRGKLPHHGSATQDDRLMDYGIHATFSTLLM